MVARKIIFRILIAVVIIVFAASFTSCCFIADKAFNIRSSAEEEQEQAEEERIEEEIEQEPDMSLEDPNAAITSVLSVPGQAIDVDVRGDYAYLTNDLGVVYIIDISDKEAPFIVGKCTNVDSANIIIIQGNYAYVSYTSWQIEEGEDPYTNCGFKILDISNKKDPVVVGDFNTGEKNKKGVFGLFIEDDYAYLTSNYYDTDTGTEISHLEIVDISDKEKPELEGKISLEGSPAGVFVDDDYAYVNSNIYDYDNYEYLDESYVYVIDVDDHSNPGLIGEVEVPYNSWGIYVKDDHVYTTSNVYDENAERYYNSTLNVVDVTKKDSPKPKHVIEVPGAAWEMDEKSGFLYMSDLTGGIHAISIDGDGEPGIINSLNTGAISYDITLYGGYGYIADGFGGLVIIELSAEDAQGGMTVENGENRAPVAEMGIYGDVLADGYIETDIPIYFSGNISYDPDGDEITYDWEITGINDMPLEPVASEDDASYIFREPGRYTVTMTVSDGELNDKDEMTILVKEQGVPVIPIREHNFTVEIEYTLYNNSDIPLKDIECYMRTPQSYNPYQKINSITTNVSETEQFFDNKWNIMTRFKFDEDLVVQPGEELTALMTCDVSMTEYDYIQSGEAAAYDENDMDLELYTKDDLFIDSDSDVIKNTAKAVIGDETDPYTIAKLLYNYVINNLEYDWVRAADKHYEFWYASEILENRRGVCSDYSILYSALLRASGIPCRLSAGIPVYVLLFEPDKELDTGHAWVEVKLPGYGWIPVDITPEDSFLSRNYYLNLTTEKGISYLYEALTMDWSSYYYDGFKYDWDGNESPDTDQTFIYRVEDLSVDEMEVSEEENFRLNVEKALVEYNDAINELNIKFEQTEGMYNEPQIIEIGEEFLEDLKSISEKLESLEYPQTMAMKRNDIVAMSQRVWQYQQNAVECCEVSNYDCYTQNFDLLFNTVGQLFEYYNKHL